MELGGEWGKEGVRGEEGEGEGGYGNSYFQAMKKRRTAVSPPGIPSSKIYCRVGYAE